MTNSYVGATFGRGEACGKSIDELAIEIRRVTT